MEIKVGKERVYFRVFEDFFKEILFGRDLNKVNKEVMWVFE